MRFCFVRSDIIDFFYCYRYINSRDMYGETKLCVIKGPSNSNIDIPERFQSKVLRIITNAPRYVPNAMLRRDLQVLSVKQEVMNHSITYRQRLINHPNQLATTLYLQPTYNRRLKRCHPADLQTRYKT